MSEFRDLPVELDQDEVVARGAELAIAVSEHGTTVNEAKLRRAEVKAEVDQALARVRRIALAIEKGVEVRSVAVTASYDREHGRMVTTRDDTQEVIETRPMTAKEIEEMDQGVLFGPEATEQAVSVADAMDEAQRKARARAEFSLPAWAGDRLSDEQTEKLIAAGLAEVTPLLNATFEDIADAGDIDPAVAAKLLDDLETEFGGATPSAVEVLAANLGQDAQKTAQAGL